MLTYVDEDGVHLSDALRVYAFRGQQVKGEGYIQQQKKTL